MVHTPSKHLNDPLWCSQGAAAGVIDGVANQPARVQQLRQPELDGVPVASNLLGCTRFKTVREQAQLEPLILDGDDVLDFGTGLGLLQGESGYQDALVGGDPRGRPSLELRQGAVGGGQSPHDRHCFQL